MISLSELRAGDYITASWEPVSVGRTEGWDPIGRGVRIRWLTPWRATCFYSDAVYLRYLPTHKFNLLTKNEAVLWLLTADLEELE